MAYLIFNGKAVGAQEAVVPVQDRGFRYGDGVFETIGVHSGVPYHFNWHMQRLAKGLKAIKIPYDTGLLKQQCKELMLLNNVNDGLLRIQITRGIGSRGYLPDLKSIPTSVVETMERSILPPEPVSLWLSELHRIPLNALPVNTKLAQGLNSTLARLDAGAHVCFDSLQLTQEGFIAETSAANIFWIKDNTLFTPSLDVGVVEGSIRAAVMKLSPYKVQEVKAPLDALAAAESVFITNVGWHVVPVKSLEPAGMQWKTVAVAKQLNLLLTVDIERHSREHKADWQTT